MIFVSRRNSPATVIHRLHPFSKMAAGMGLSALALCLHSPAALAVLLAFVFTVLAAARIRPTLRQVLSLLAFFTVFSAVNFVINHDPVHAATYTLRFAVFLTAMPMLSLTTDPQQLTRALAATPLPAGISMALLLVWRFFPLLAADVRQMRQAARLRDRGEDGAARRLYRGVLVPLAFSVIEYADRVTLALELRGFSPDVDRTCANRPRIGQADVMFSLLALTASCAAAWLQWGAGT